MVRRQTGNRGGSIHRQEHGCLMAYWLDDGFDMWPEVIRAGSAAVGLYARCGAWIARNIGSGAIVDALVPAEVAAMYGTPEWVRRLVDAGLWAPEGDAYRDVRYFVLNPTSEKVRELRDRRAEAGRKGGLVSGAKRSKGLSKRQASASANAQANGEPSAVAIVEPPSLPPPSTKGEGDARPASPRDNPDWRRMPAYGTQRDPTETERTAAKAAEIRASLRRPSRFETGQQRKDSLAELNAAVAEIRPPPEASDAEAA